MPTKLVIDSNSIINFVKYHCFDKHDKSELYNKLETFILSKIKNKEIIVIDKVLQELRNPDTQDIKTKIKPYEYNTEHLLDKIEPLIEENLVLINLRRYGDWELETLKQEYKEKHADLYLISVCEEMKLQNPNIILISEETINKDKKIVEKIPTICKRRNIEYTNLPDMIFKIYKNELIFDLEVEN